jgi:STE24 endopeptidase
MARYVELPWTPLYTQSSASSHGAAVGASSSSSTSPFSMYALAGTIAFTACVYALEAHLDSRQKRSYQKTRFPQELEETVSAIDVERAAAAKDGGSSSQSTQEEDSNNKGEKKQVDDNKPLLPQLREKFSKAQAYGLDKISFGMVASSYDTMETIAFLMLGYFPYCWDASARIGREYLGYDETEHEIKVSLVFLLITTLVSTITSLPFELYSTFQIERKHGFNTQTVGLFVSDKVKSLLLTIAIGGPFSAVLLHIIKWGGQYFYVYVWGFMFCFSVLMITIIPIWIMPLFNKYDPLPESPLKTRIFELAGQLNYPLTKLFVMDGSKRSSHSNAFMFGFWKNKRIVLFDTLLKQVTESEILAILGHELGHWKVCYHP